MKKYYSLILSISFILVSYASASEGKQQYHPCLTQCNEHYDSGTPLSEFNYFDEDEDEDKDEEDDWGMGGADDRSDLRKELRELEKCSSDRSVCWWGLKKAGAAITGADRFSSCHDICIAQFKKYLYIQ